MRCATTTILLLAFPWILQAAEPDWDALIAKAEEPLTSFRANYAKALRARMEAEREKGSSEETDVIAAELKHFDAGGWPDGESGSDKMKQMEATFIIYFGRIRSSVSSRMEKVAALDKSGVIKARIEERLKHWNEAYSNTKRTMISYVWKTKGPLHTKLAGNLSGAPNRSARELLEHQGIIFLPGTSADYNAEKSELTVRNTIRNMLRIDQMLIDNKLR